MRQNAKDLLVLLLHIGIVLLIFANIIFLVEDSGNIDSVPQGWWLGLVTITKVGYSDFTPKTAFGKIVCSMCAIPGIVMQSLIIPIFVNTFVVFYGMTSCINDNNGNVKNSEKKKTNYVTVVPIKKSSECFTGKFIGYSETKSRENLHVFFLHIYDKCTINI